MTRGIAYADRASWLEARRNGIGGSDAAAILGVSRFSTAYDVWEDKVTTKPEKPATVRMTWGRRLEDVVADALVEERGLRLRRSNRILVHPELPFVIGSVDRLAKDAVVEIKVSRSGDAWATEEEAPRLDPVDRVPRDYYVQGQHYAAVTGKPRVLFGVLVGGNDLRLLETPRDDAFVADLLEEESAFWHDHVETGIPPELTAADAGRLPKLFPRGSGERVATPEVDRLLEELLEVRAREDQEAKARAELEVKIKEFLGEASDLVSSVARVTWRNAEKRTVAWEQIARGLRGAIERIRENTLEPDAFVDRMLSDSFGTTDLDDLERLYTSTSTYRTLRLDRKGNR